MKVGVTYGDLVSSSILPWSCYLYSLLLLLGPLKLDPFFVSSSYMTWKDKKLRAGMSNFLFWKKLFAIYFFFIALDRKENVW